MKKTKNICFVITHSLGELDCIFPIIADLSHNYKVNVKIIFVIKSIYDDYERSIFYKYCSKEFNVNIEYYRLINKFDNFFHNKKFIYKLSLNLYLWFKLIIFEKFFIKYNYVFYQHTGFGKLRIFLSILSKICKFNILIYQHAMSFNQPNSIPKNNFLKPETFLLFSKLNKEYMLDLGYHNNLIIGFPKFYKIWVDFIGLYSQKKIDKKKNVVIFTRVAPHNYYLSIEDYKYLLSESYKSIRELVGNCTVIIKPHPRENFTDIKNLINSNNFTNVEISNEHSAVLSKDAFLTISFWSSTILDSLSVDTPAVEFFKESKKFRQIEPKGSLYKYHGIDSVDNVYDLKKFINKVIDNKYSKPEILLDLQRELNPLNLD